MENVPYSCVQCGFYHCKICCPHRVVLPGLEVRALLQLRQLRALIDVAVFTGINGTTIPVHRTTIYKY